MVKIRPVVAAVHFERGPEYLEPTVESLLNKDMRAVVTCSIRTFREGGASRQALKSLPPEVGVLYTGDDKKRGGVRNIVADSADIISGGHDPILYFTNSGVSPLSPDIADRIRDALEDRKTGAVGGQIIDEHGRPIQHNYGRLMDSIPAVFKGYGQAAVLEALRLMPDAIPARQLRVRLGGLFNLDEWPDTFEDPKENTEPLADNPFPVGWLNEASLAIGLTTFNQARRFPNVDVHETQELSYHLKRLEKACKIDREIQSQQRTSEILSGIKPDSFKGVITAFQIARACARQSRQDRAMWRTYALSDPLER